MKILVVEDEENNFIYIEEILSNFRITILHASNGMEAVEYIKKDKDIDMVLMDIKMPLMDGYEATKKIKEIRNDIYIIALTACVGAKFEKESYLAGCCCYISKPFTPDYLIKKIKLFLDI